MCDLISQYLPNDNLNKDFERLVKENELLIYKVCRIYTYTESDIMDLYQDIVVQLWQSYSTFRGDSKFSTWLYRVAINTAIRYLKKDKSFIREYRSSDFTAFAVEDNSAEKEEQLQDLYKAIEKLNEIEKALVMLFLENKSYDEMEEILGINQNTLRVKMNRVKDKLRKLTK